MVVHQAPASPALPGANTEEGAPKWSCELPLPPMQPFREILGVKLIHDDALLSAPAPVRPDAGSRYHPEPFPGCGGGIPTTPPAPSRELPPPLQEVWVMCL